MTTDSLIFQNSPIVTLATNRFINVPVILKYEDTNLIEIIHEIGVGFTTQIPIYHADGTYLAKVTGNRIYPTEQGKKAGIEINKLQGVIACKMNNQTIFEIHQQTGDAFKAYAELHTPEGYFVKCTDSAKPILMDAQGTSLKVGGIIMSSSTIKDYKVGIWLRKDGSCSVAVNK